MIRSIIPISALETVFKMPKRPSCYTCSRIFRVGRETQQHLQGHNVCVNHMSSQNPTPLSTTVKENDEEVEKPVVFTKSKAFNTTPGFLNPNYKQDHPKYQDISISISFSCFCIYFFYLREENDYDKLLEVSLYDRIEGLEKANVLAAIMYHEKNNMDTTDLKRRLDELVAEEEAIKAEYDRQQKELSDYKNYKN